MNTQTQAPTPFEVLDEAPAAVYLAPDPFPVTEVIRPGYGLVTAGRADINPAVHPDMEFDGDGDLLPPREWGA